MCTRVTRGGHTAGVLDVAGGRGEVSFELQEVHGVRSTLVEPRPWSPWKLSRRQRGVLKARGTPPESFTLPHLQCCLDAESWDAHPQVWHTCNHATRCQ